ncbi:MAG: copper resistance CopC family protein [Rhodothermales bacterium]
MKALLSLAATLLFLSAFSSDQHLRLIKSAPEKDSTLTEMPTEIRLWFNQNIHMNVSEITLHQLMNHDGMTHEMPVELPAALASEDPKSFFVPLPDSLGIGDGTWKVSWATAGNDEHVVDGSFTFSIDSE